MGVVPADLVQVVVLAGHTQNFLRIDRARIGTFVRAKENILELDHAGVGEKQGGIPSRHQRSGRDKGMVVFDKEINKGLADLAHRWVSGSFWLQLYLTNGRIILKNKTKPHLHFVPSRNIIKMGWVICTDPRVGGTSMERWRTGNPSRVTFGQGKFQFQMVYSEGRDDNDLTE